MYLEFCMGGGTTEKFQRGDEVTCTMPYSLHVSQGEGEVECPPSPKCTLGDSNEQLFEALKTKKKIV